MRERIICFGIIAILLMMSVPSAAAESPIVLDEIVTLSDIDLGIEGAAIDPDGKRVLLHGADGYIGMVFAQTPTIQVELIWSESQKLNDASWHPGGSTAFIVGEDGIILRYANDDLSVTLAGERLNYGQTELTAVAWNTAGSWAYVGGDDGWLWRVRAEGNGGLEVHEIIGRGSSLITGIECHDDLMICVVSSAVDGIGIIDRDHTLTWIGGVGYPWSDVICPTNFEPTCVASTTSKQIGLILLSTEGAAATQMSINDIVGVDGRFMQLTHQYDDRSLVVLAPFGLIEHDISNNATYPWLDNEDAQKFDTTISGDRIVGTWGTEQDSGWIVTSRGTLIEYHPSKEREAIGGLLGIIIQVTIPLVILMMIFTIAVSFSPKLQYWVTMKIGSEEEKRDAKRIAHRKAKNKKK
ncbi:MAG: WD40 repeat domain-containing protein [Euryarchaeota archaeon]|jgi:WD40 repeat protein|nr:WD40 repeat domain-containing protein [Euryarchaeota archaeon]MBT3653735.1 WD40 repeat domain-containing protein [Euryarchaeota archaeon]MBT3757790.1 WD40 repeat domain-containing protein [Euryarchaeota archaeon]MBT4051136.1 WD40 repeat domain-containing protein [Euryarchaeota archaeon]MBT4649958.1 WD40 repeat domain-containing protein [Euryarchaeota archaeon]